ncbi:serine/threonine-protein phosphatase 7 long form homolog [Nicotiana sylvestris]|uniref:serine/threonine-protein phosphatase 7 long form homolog n=1 Tax=Nicotiana sylvestris TaxID=4096 RepID=UPI00388CBE71
MTRGHYLDMMGQFTGYRPQGDAVQRGGSRVALSGIRDHMAFLHPDITSEMEDLHIERYTRLALLLLFGCVLFPNTSGSLVSMRFLHHLQQLDDLPLYSWGDAVLAYLYRSMCQASMLCAVDICGFLPLLQRIMSLQTPLPPLAPGEAYPFLPLASRWVLRRGNYRGTDAHHNLLLVRDMLDMLVAEQFIWTPYSNELLAQLPNYCLVDQLLWSTSVPMIFFYVVEYHATECVLRQFHRPQPIPEEPAWVPTHYQRDDRVRVDDIFMGWLEQQVYIWEQREYRIPPPPSFTQEATIHLYSSWYRRHTRLVIGNPIHVLGERYRPYAGRHESLAIGHHMVYQLGQEIQQHANSVALVEYGRWVVDLARRTLFQARDGMSLDHEAQYAVPEDYHRVEDRLTRDVDGRRRLSYASSPAVDADLPHAQASSQPIFEATTCFDEDTTDAYTQEADETTVVDGPTAYSSDPASCGVDAVTHPHIKRWLDDDDPDSVRGRQGMQLRPATALKHTGCWTH